MTKTIGIGLMSLMIITPQPSQIDCGGWILWGLHGTQFGPRWYPIEEYNSYASCQEAKLVNARKHINDAFTCFSIAFDPR